MMTATPWQLMAVFTTEITTQIANWASHSLAARSDEYSG